MKKLLIISALLVAGLASKSQAQHFVASFGIERSWGVPDYVTHTVYDRFYNYDWVHANRVYHGGGYYSFNVLLQRGNTFLEVNFNDHGHYRIVNRYNHYPLGGHICGDFCGFHEYYYNAYYNICHSHNHWGHNHIMYRPRPVTYVYGHYRTYPRYVYRPSTTVIYNNGPSNNYQHYKKGNHKPQYTQQDGKNPHRIRLEDRYPTRRSGNAVPVTAKYSDGSSQRRSESYRGGTTQDSRNNKQDFNEDSREQYNRDARQQNERNSRQQYERNSRGKSEKVSQGRGRSGNSNGRGRGN